MRLSSSSIRIGVTIALVLAASCVTAWVQHVQAQAPAQIGASSPLPVFVTNPSEVVLLPDGFVPGSRWRFTTWTTPNAFTWVATVNKISGAWANMTVIAEDSSRHTQWYYVPGLPGSWERQ
ncbi:MAG: hypothetical protein IT165_29830 [Bryobacterales bacterium]|nr:hypothetical protein [Bryobacterales bacterium]